ncbi:MAG: 3-oxoacyl-(acyl-carrier-protein) synthase 3 [Lentisphaerae bacterium ADurb.Bin242]|nr:MAG: 3-oxoacyl-(acyl-carrier-protein) synthase 3 [Lentisphaerae bacterium ADurb.Bin242]
MSIRIIGTGSYTPDRILRNSDLEKMVDTTDEWITSRTGIKERHIADKDTPTSELAKQAALRAIEMAGIQPEQLDLISIATATPDTIFPSTACVLQRKIGAVNAACYDLVAACTGLIYSLEVAYSLLKAFPRKYRYALVLGADKLSSIVNWEDRSTCVLFGDGASAVVLYNNMENDQPDFVVESKIGAAGIYADLLSMPAGGSAKPASHETVDQHLHCIQMSGKELFKLAVAGLVDSCKEVLTVSGISAEEIAWVIPHQANMRIISAAAQRLDIPVERVYVNIEKYGNTSAASIGICLDELCRGGKLKKDDCVLITAFGGGLTWGAMLIRW